MSARARALVADVEKRTGRAPAILALISHPPVLGELAHLNVSLVRHASLALRAARGRPCRPRLVVAIDPFALDTTQIAEEGVYAGYMGTFHVGIDRMALGGGRPGVALTPRAAWPTMALRFFGILAEGGEVGIMLGGGVPGTSRVLYGVREWARRARAISPLRVRPADVERALRADAAFARFLRAVEGSIFPPPRTWRLIDAWLMTAAAGLLPEDNVEAAAAAALSCLAVPESARAGLLADLAREFARETPRRARFFRVLAERVARRRPVVMIPVAHTSSPVGIAAGEAWSWEWAGRGRLNARKADAPGVCVETTPEAFADLFVEGNFA